MVFHLKQNITDKIDPLPSLGNSPDSNPGTQVQSQLCAWVSGTRVIMTMAVVIVDVRQFCGNPTVTEMGAGKIKIKILKTFGKFCCTIFYNYPRLF